MKLKHFETNLSEIQVSFYYGDMFVNGTIKLDPEEGCSYLFFDGDQVTMSGDRLEENLTGLKAGLIEKIYEEIMVELENFV